ncbi:MAG: radical SAM protein [Elusimicrobiota bacterium]
MAPVTHHHIPRSGLLDNAREMIKPILKRMGGARLYGSVTGKCHWGLVFLNYLLMRNRTIARLLRVGAWPQSLYIEGTNICNARCIFCAYPQMMRPKKTMPLDHFKNVIDQYALMGGSEVDLTPIVGDPFADRFLFERLDYLNSLPDIRRFHFFTNAILMGSEDYPKLAAYGSKLTVYNSFGGFTRPVYHQVMGVDKFDEAVGAIRGLIEAKRRSGSELGIQVNLRVPPGDAKGEFWDYLRSCAAEGLISIDGINAFDSWAGAIKEEDLASAGLAARPMPEKRGPCHRLLTTPVVLADGRVNACACRDVEAELIIGDLKDQSLAQILSGDKLHELIEQHDRGEFPPVCQRCTYYDSLYPGWMRG